MSHLPRSLQTSSQRISSRRGRLLINADKCKCAERHVSDILPSIQNKTNKSLFFKITKKWSTGALTGAVLGFLRPWVKRGLLEPLCKFPPKENAFNLYFFFIKFFFNFNRYTERGGTLGGALGEKGAG